MTAIAKLPEVGDAPWSDDFSGAKLTRISGWGRFPTCPSYVFRPEKISALQEIVSRRLRPLIARGAGRSYGDAALNSDHAVADLTRLNRMLSFDAASGVLRCEAGVTFADLLETFVRRGFFPPVTPGTKYVTMGGALAADVHGKNHHRESSFSAHVLSFDLMLASGDVIRCSREHNSDAFWATVGGMGLTGIVTEVELRLMRIPSAWVRTRTEVARDLDEALRIFDENDAAYGYSVGWLDCGPGARGRGLISFANFASLDELSGAAGDQPYTPPPRFAPSVPIDLPDFAMNALTARVFNELRFRNGARHAGRSEVTGFEHFFYHFDALNDSNRLYGKRGFTQYQCVLPPAHSRAGLIEIVDELQRSRCWSPLATLKRFGAQEGIMSFPMPGYTLAMDFPLVRPGLLEIMNRLDRLVAARGGRIYLAKDARMSAEFMGDSYPQVARWRTIRDRLDPDGVFASDLSRRLNLSTQAC